MPITKKKVVKKAAPRKKGKHGGARPGGGRPPGLGTIAQRNIEKLEKLGFDPIEFLAHVAMGNYQKLKMKKEELTTPLRIQAAKDVAPYVATKLRSMELTDPDGKNPIKSFVEALKDATDKANK